MDGNPWYPVKNIRVADWMCADVRYCCCMSKETGDPVGSTCWPYYVNFPDYGAVWCFNPCGDKTSGASAFYVRIEIWKC